MKRIGALFVTIIIILVSMAGMWFYQSWRDGQVELSENEYKNAYVIMEPGKTVKVYVPDGNVGEYTVNGELKQQSYTGIGDVTVYRKRLKKLVKKPDVIKGRVLSIQDQSIEVDQYGVLPLDDNCSFFCLAQTPCVAQKDSLYVGQDNVTFSVANGQICSVVFPDTEKNTDNVAAKEEKIRVILKTEDFGSYEHAEVKLRGNGGLTVSSGDEKTHIEKGKEWTVSYDSMKSDKYVVECSGDERMELLSLKRNKSTPSYRGKLEITKGESGLRIVNEVDLEQYLYGVVPSEMPAEYNAEALKAQAVCARSYALLHIKNNRLKQYGAHVDDSVSYQVYQNSPEDERCSKAVDETKGKKVLCNGEIASTYFFSTSCGTTTSSKDVFFTGEDVLYLQGKLQEADTANADKLENAKLVADTFGDDDLFCKFLDEDRNVLDKSQPWYRWSTTISLEDIEHNINKKLGERCERSGERIEVRQKDGRYIAQKIDSIGKLKRIRIKERKSGGVVYMAVFVGSKATIRVYSEYNLRQLIFNENAIIRKQDGKDVSGLSMLPSGFFTINKSGSSYEIKGGGFGHGTGMSQTGANELAGVGKTYEEILKYYFAECEIG